MRGFCRQTPILPTPDTPPTLPLKRGGLLALPSMRIDGGLRDPHPPPRRLQPERRKGLALSRAAPAGLAGLVALSQRGYARERRRVRDRRPPRRRRTSACRSPTSAPARAIIRSAFAAGRAARAGCSPRISCPETIRALAQRIQRERLDNVAIRLGQPNDPQLPAGLVRPRLHDPHVSRDRAALRVPVEFARRR